MSPMKNSPRNIPPTPDPAADNAAADAPIAASLAPSDGALHDFGFQDETWIDRIRRVRDEPALDRIGNYEVLAAGAPGGQGTVYRCRNADGRIVALKRIHGGPRAARAARERLVRELHVAASLSHPSIVPVRPVELESELALEMDWIDGVPFDLWAFRGDHGLRERRGTGEMLDLLGLICDAVQHAHERGVVHRDLKPSNILVDHEGRPHILDFGIARPLADFSAAASQVTLTDQMVGTPAYASPEQVAGMPGEIDARSDVYSLGVMMYEAFTGVSPYPPGVSLGRLLNSIEFIEPRRPRAIDRSIPREIEAVILRALRKRPQQRYASARDLGEDLQRCAAGQSPRAARPDLFFDLRFIARRHPAMTGLVASSAAIMIVAGALVGLYTLRLRAARDDTLAAHQAAERVNELLTNLLYQTEGFSDPPNSKLAGLLDDADKWIAEELNDDRWALARAQVAFGRMYAQLEQWEKAEKHLAAALDEYRGLGKADRPNVAAALSGLGLARAYLGDARAVPTQREALAMIVRLNPPPSREPANYFAALGETLLVTSAGAQVKDADQAFAQAFRLTQAIPNWHASLMLSRARALLHVNAPEDALAVLRDAIEIFERSKMSPADRNYRQCLKLLVDALNRTGKSDEAEIFRKRFATPP
jgi:tRNA A-37 threonylcarbamoyl transferase component Bud32/tetratricopeptide (TPR) repeat protein